jgi:hypothetical protein
MEILDLYNKDNARFLETVFESKTACSKKSPGGAF